MSASTEHTSNPDGRRASPRSPSHSDPPDRSTPEPPVSKRGFAGVGATVLTLCRDAGGIALLAIQVLRALLPPRIDGRNLLEHLYKMGYQSIPIIVLAAFFAGALMTIQSQILVERFGATALLGWGGGYAVFRELAPVLLALMFAGRVGSNNTADLGTMAITDQIDGLRALAIDPVSYLLVPRVVAMVIALFALTAIGGQIALLSGTAFAMLLYKVEFITLFASLVENVSQADFIHGLVKSIAFGISIALSSCYYGITVRGGAVGVGRAVNASVVSAAMSVFVLDFFLTYLLP